MREFAYDDGDFLKASRLLKENAGIVLGPSKRDLVYSRLIRRLRHHGDRSFRSYLGKIHTRLGELEAFVNALTTNLTAFYREPHHFRVLEQYARAFDRSRKLRVWCAAASTGEEPYSIALTLAECYGAAPPPAEILATDVDTSVLDFARRGIYEMARVAPLPVHIRNRYFLKGIGARSGSVRLCREVRESVHFVQMNLLADRWPNRGRFDVIFCRNVFIYFDRVGQRKTLQHFSESLQPGGLLIMGHSESLFYASDLFRSIDRTVYQHA